MIYITGDCHGDFRRFSNKKFEGKEGDVVIVLGDFGLVWDGSKTDDYWIKWFSKKPYQILFIDGNHENFDKLKEYPEMYLYGGKVHRITDNVFHLMRGEVYEIEGEKFFVFGGARSHDVDEEHIVEQEDMKKRKLFRKTHQFYRMNHVSWWKEEILSTLHNVESQTSPQH